MEHQLASFEHFDKKLISILEILVSYFVDIYYNHVYSSAVKKVETASSLTDEYIRQVKAYVMGVKTDEVCYKKVIHNLHVYFQETTRHSIMPFADFVDKIVQQFIPPEYYDLLKLNEKDETLGSIIVDLVSGLGVYITTPKTLVRIIDEHELNPRVTIRMIQNNGVALLLTKRGTIHNHFLQKIGQSKSTVSLEVVDDLEQKLQAVTDEKKKLAGQLNEFKSRVAELDARIAQGAKREEKYKTFIRMIRKEMRNKVAAPDVAQTPPPPAAAEEEVVAEPAPVVCGDDFFASSDLPEAVVAPPPRLSRSRIAHPGLRIDGGGADE